MTIFKVLIIVLMTHGLRLAARRIGPRWGGLLLGLPCSTAIVLFFLGLEQGTTFAAEAAKAGLLGLAGAITFSLCYVWVVARGQSLLLTLFAAVAGYFVSAAAVVAIVPRHTGWMFLASLAVVVGGMYLARLLVAPESRGGQIKPSMWRSMILRTLIPVVCLLSVTEIAGVSGSLVAGLLSTFPATFAAVLMVTHLESGSREAAETAKAFPQGNLSMVGFVAIFSVAAPTLGLVGGMGIAYAAAVAILIGGRLFSRPFGRLLTWLDKSNRAGRSRPNAATAKTSGSPCSPRPARIIKAASKYGEAVTQRSPVSRRSASGSPRPPSNQPANRPVKNRPEYSV